jgi:glycosyltransferase involved in cell wall biosynthesis/SAM-dependent methyltransferase
MTDWTQSILKRDELTDNRELKTSISVVITTYNHAHFLTDAIDSVLAQTHRADDIIVIDDGSTDNPDRIVERYPGIKFVRQENLGLAAARNKGLNAASSDAIVFLDADDRLLPNALETGLACLASKPESSLVYGGYRCTDTNWSPIGSDNYIPVQDAYVDFLRGNLIGMHATVLYSRKRLLEIGGFDPSLRRCEDYDVYLRMAQAYPMASHANVTAEYRIHGSNMSANPREMLRWALEVLDRQKHLAFTRDGGAEAWRCGRRSWREYYGEMSLIRAQEAWSRGERKTSAREFIGSVLTSPQYVKQEAMKAAREYLRKALPPTVVRGLRYLRSRPSAPSLGRVKFGDLDRSAPIDDNFGYGRGTPIDRYYVAEFLRRHAEDMLGRVLEVGDDDLSRRFGGDRITHQDILHVRPGNPRATIVGDLAVPGVLPPGTFDCLILTQTLHLIYDMASAVREIHRALKPNGVVLLTVPGISRIDRGEWRESWYWSLTEYSARRMFAEVFGAEQVNVEVHGNVFAAIAFLHGLALEEVPPAKLDIADPAFPVIISVRAQKASHP